MKFFNHLQIIFSNLQFFNISRVCIFANPPFVTISRGFNFANLNKICETCKNLILAKINSLKVNFQCQVKDLYILYTLTKSGKNPVLRHK